jgi:DNA-binding SARP family transcriptional activator
MGADQLHGFEIHVLGSFALLRGGRETHSVPGRVQRLLGYLSVRPGRHPRNEMARVLWPATPYTQSNNLRQALHVTRRYGDVVESDRLSIWLNPSVGVDLWQSRELIDQVRAGVEVPPPLLERLEVDLLPGWSEPWVVSERARYRTLRSTVLTEMAAHALSEDRIDLARAAASVALSVDPLDETAVVQLVRAYLRAGNRVEAYRAYEQHRRLLETQMGWTVSSRLEQLALRWMHSDRPHDC